MEPDTLALVRFCIDMACVAAFALSGVLAARDRKAELDLFGVVVVAVVTAIGGGTLRDVPHAMTSAPAAMVRSVVLTSKPSVPNSTPHTSASMNFTPRFFACSIPSATSSLAETPSAKP